MHNLSHHRGGRSAGRIAIVLAAVTGLVAAAAISFTIALSNRAEPRKATILPEPVALPEFRLTDHTGAALTRDWFDGRHTLVFFGFTQCPDICPITLQQLASAARRLAAQGGTEPPSILFVSVDPDRDSVAAVADYVSAFGEGVHGARGSLDALEALTAALGVYHARPPADDGGYTVEHSAAVFVIDESARLCAVFGAPHEIDELVHDWPLVVAAS